MIYGFSGLPGAGKTLNAVKFTVEEELFQGRQRFYHGVPLLFFDYQVCCDFKGWFYGVFFPANVNSQISKKIKAIHNEGRYAELDDFPFLAEQYRKHDGFALWLKWVKCCYPKAELNRIREVCAILQIPESDLKFEHIEHLNLHWTQFANPHKWIELPQEAVIVIDEIQDIWGVRAAGASVPPAVEGFATHRHKGWDLVIISQDFRDCDVYIRRRIGNHKHILNYGLRYLKQWEDHKLIATDDGKALWRLGSKKITKDKRFFGVYLSAVLHTHKPKLPRKVKLALYILVFSLLTLFSGIYYIVNQFSGSSSELAEPTTTASPATPVTLGTETLTDVGKLPLFSPRVESLPFTAPVFDKRVMNTELHIPTLFCYAVELRCKCYTQQGTRYNLPQHDCMNIAQFGAFDYFKETEDRRRR